MCTTIRLGISSCLMGEKVRYDGQHKLDHYLRDELGSFVEYIPVCPEAESGFSIPREAMRLVGDISNPRLFTVNSKVDVTQKMTQWIAMRIKQLEGARLDGYIFKSKSPSSGMERIKVYPSPEGGMPTKKGVGLFARAFMDHFPTLPVEDEGRMHDPVLRENFIERVFVHARWQTFLGGKPDKAGLIAFHRRHKLLLMAHDVASYRSIGKMVAQLSKADVDTFLVEYIALLMKGLSHKATLAKNTNVLQHIMGYFKKQLSHDEKQEAVELIQQYHDGLIPLIVPVTLLNHYVRKYQTEYLLDQYYLHPHPAELKLRNHA
ncbi:MAG: DUF1722 domain-containing protein [Spartobacteria bacterium]|nr:DUF1722 domain-containing protein [Spartobacteria bacterium]